MSLNTWGGRVSGIDDFIIGHAHDTDIFCFQEMYGRNSSYANLSLSERPAFFEEIEKLIPEFTGFFSELLPGVGLAVFIKNHLSVEKVSMHWLLEKDEVAHLVPPDGTFFYPRIMQAVYFNDPKMLLINFHGIPGNGKRDTPERVLQMKRLHEVIDACTGKQIILGDFNLNPDTEAIRGLETKFRNLIAEYEIKSTRTNLYPKWETSPFADYAFVTSGISVSGFEVLPHVVSDHAPLMLTIDIV
jgi:hypothetical protein